MLQKKYSFLLILFYVFTVQVFSQSTCGIKGIVRDSLTGETIPFAAILIVDQNLGQNANHEGFYMLKGIRPGAVNVQVSAVGYKKYKGKINLKADDFTYLLIKLAPEPVELSGVTTESERIKSTSLANISVQSINLQEFKSMPMTIERDVMRTLRVLPGINAASDVTGQLFVRGGASDQNLVYCDNLKIANPYHAMGLFSIFNGDIVRSFDAITGGFDPEYGGRLSSVIKINTRDGNRNDYKLKLNAGILSGSAMTEGPLFGGSYLVSFRRSYFDDILKKILKDEVSLTFYDYFAKYSADFGSEGSMEATAIGSGDYIDRKFDADPSYEWSTFAFGVTLQSFVKNILLSWTTSYSSYRMEENYVSTYYGKNSNSTYSSLSVNAKAELPFENNDGIIAGFDMDVYSVKNHFVNSYDYGLASGDNAPVISIYLKYKMAFIKNLLLDIGVRQNKIGFDNQVLNLFEPRMNVKYNLTEKFAIKASATRMHQYIISNIDENDFIPLYEAWLCLKNPTADVKLSRNPLNPERADQAVLGFDAYFWNNYRLTIQGYYKDIKNYVGYNPYRKTSDDVDFVTGTGISKGIEFFFKFNFNSFDGWITYNYAKVEKENGGISYAPRYDKRHSLSLVLGYTLPYKIKFGANWDFSSGMPFTPLLYFWDQPSNDNMPYTPGFPSISEYAKYGVKNSRRLPVYHKLDLSFSREFILNNFPNLEVNVSINNVYDRKNIFYYNRKTGKRVNMMPFLLTASMSIEI